MPYISSLPSNSPQANLPRWNPGSQIATIAEVNALIAAAQANTTTTPSLYLQNTTQNKRTPVHVEGANGSQTLVLDDAI